MEFLLNFTTWYKTLPASGKISLILVLIGAITAGFLINKEIKTTGYSYLYTNLSLTDSNAIAERLQSMNVEAKIQGDAVLVPGSRVLELRNMFASEGLPQGGGTGFEIFDKQNFGATEFEQRVNYIRALQGEIARTISAIDGVESARLHVVMPEKKLFNEDMEHARASVALTLYKGRKLSAAQIRGIVHLVLTSIEGLSESHINIIDQNGNTLFEAAGSDASGTSAKNLSMKSDLERTLEKRVASMVEKIVGPGGASVSISAEMNFSQVERTVESFDPESRVAIAESTITDTSSGSTGGAAGGAPGAAANLPGGAAGTTGNGRSETAKRTETQSTYAVSKTIQKILEPVGEVRRLTVAVLVDGNYIEAEDGTKTYQPRSEEEIQKITELVQKAVGFNTVRGDEVSIENMQFRRLDIADDGQAEFVEATNSSRWMMFLIDNGIMLAIALIAGIIFLMLVKLVNSYAPPMQMAYANVIGESAGSLAKQLPSAADVNIVQRDDEAARQKAEEIANQMPEIQQSKDNSPGINFVESKPNITVETPMTSEEKLRLQAAKMQTEQLISGNTEEAVQIIRSWLSED